MILMISFLKAEKVLVSFEPINSHYYYYYSQFINTSSNSILFDNINPGDRFPVKKLKIYIYTKASTGVYMRLEDYVNNGNLVHVDNGYNIPVKYFWRNSLITLGTNFVLRSRKSRNGGKSRGTFKIKPNKSKNLSPGGIYKANLNVVIGVN